MLVDNAPILQVEELVTGYGKKEVLHGISLSLTDGEIVALIGHNGAGKSTFLKTIFGLLPVWSGRIAMGGKQLERHSPRSLLREGVAYVPQGNRVFGDLTVKENLEIGRLVTRDERRFETPIEDTIGAFNTLKARLQQRAGSLSGGEKQMLAFASAMIRHPRILLLDEPSLGLAPRMIMETLRRIQAISSQSRTAVLLVEQKVREVLKIADRVCVMRRGQVTYIGRSEELQDDDKLREVYL